MQDLKSAKQVPEHDKKEKSSTREWLEYARNFRGMTQEQVAKELSITPSYYCFIERGKRKVKMDILFLYKLCDILQMDRDKALKLEARWREALYAD